MDQHEILPLRLLIHLANETAMQLYTLYLFVSLLWHQVSNNPSSVIRT